MPFVITTPTPTDTEDLTLDGLALNNSILGLSALSCPPPRQRQEWIGAADSEHQALVRDPLYDNRKVTATINVIPSGDMDAALDSIGGILDKLLASSKSQDGIELTWSPATSTRTVTFDVLSGEITDLPIDWENGWLAKAPQVTVEMTCKPFWRGVETLTAITSSSTPIVTAELVNNGGDVPALGRLIVTDTASQSRRHVEWGLEGPGTYNATTSLLLDSDSLVTSGFAGAGAVAGPSGAYDPNATGNNVILAALQPQATAVCGTGNQSHIGSFRVKARVYFGNVPADIRFSWRAGDGPMTANAWTTVTQGTSWLELDLGTVTVPAAGLGTQRWTGQVEASATTATNMLVDFLVLVPVTDGYGKARATYSYRSGVLTGYDAFAGTTAGGALNARVAPAGGTWATSGATTDFAFADGTASELVTRATSADSSGGRYALLGSTPKADTEVAALVVASAYPEVGASLSLGVIARWVDANNYLRATMTVTRPLAAGSSIAANLVVTQTLAGVATSLGSALISSGIVGTKAHRLRLVVYSSGRVIAQAFDSSGAQIMATVDASSTVLASGGALDDGLAGLFDYNSGATGAGSRDYDDFQVATPAAEPIVIYSGQSIEFRHDDTEREDATGVYYGRPQSYHPAGRFRVPVGTSRVFVKARRNDVDVATNDNVTDATQIQVGIQPRGLVVPRA